MLDMANKKRNTSVAVRWAMSPNPSKLPQGIRSQRLRVEQAPLFPASSDVVGPKARTESDLAPIMAGSSGSIPGCPTPDCPPAYPAEADAPRQQFGWTRATAASCGAEDSAPLVGIARLAANSPAAESHRQSAERPEYFVLPVRSILNRCDSKRVPFEWTINPYRGCEFACKYGYARYTHEYMDLDGSEFEKKI